jgi:hypothetical protein
VGNSFSGSTVAAWLVANAVCGYNAVDHLFLEKNITTDLKQFLVPPKLDDNDGDDDVAVPFHQDVESEAANAVEEDE